MTFMPATYILTPSTTFSHEYVASSRNSPAGQMQPSEDLVPLPKVTEPLMTSQSSQNLHSTFPSPSAYFPVSHTAHSEGAMPENLPAGQLMQLVVSAVAYLPARHARHSEFASPLAYLPSSQTEQEEDATPATLPAGQDRHSVCSAFVYFPGLQVKQVEDPGEELRSESQRSWCHLI